MSDRKKALGQKLVGRYTETVELHQRLTEAMNSTNDGHLAARINHSLNLLSAFLMELDMVVLYALDSTEDVAAYIKIKNDGYL